MAITAGSDSDSDADSDYSASEEDVEIVDGNLDEADSDPNDEEFVGPQCSAGPRMPKLKKKKPSNAGDSGTRASKKAAPAPLQKTPRYREMVMKSLKGLREPKGSPYNNIAKYIADRYKVKNDFVIKHVLTWLVQKQVCEKVGNRYKIKAPKKDKKATKAVAGKERKAKDGAGGKKAAKGKRK